MTNRRNFLKTALAGSAALAASSAMALPTDRPEKFDETYDVIVVGAGGSGLAAAAHAAEKGLKVLILEKMAFPGGSSAICGGGSLVVGTDLQKKAGEKDSNELLFKDIIETGGGLNNKDVVHAFVDNHLPVYNWFMGLGGKLQSDLLFASVSANRGVEIEPNSVLKACLDHAKKHGAKLLVSTPAKRLAYDEKTKRIVGVFAEKDGKTVSFGAKKGVILASGGFARNKELLSKYVPRMAKTLTICGKGCDGDGLKMALAYGADVADMPYIKATFAFNTDPHSINDSHYTYWEGGIVVNKAGKRFVDESIPKKDVGDHVLEQEGGIGYCVYDEPTRRISLKTARNNGSVLESEERGLVFKGNTIEEVARKAGLDPKVVKDTVERYNRDVREKGGIPILLSITPRNEWPDGKMERRNDSYGQWCREVVEQTGVDFIDMHNISADYFDSIGPEATKAYYKNDHTHTSRLGAERNAESFAEGLKAAGHPLANYLN